MGGAVLAAAAFTTLALVGFGSGLAPIAVAGLVTAFELGQTPRATGAPPRPG